VIKEKKTFSQMTQLIMTCLSRVEI